MRWKAGGGGLVVFFDLGSNAHSMWISLIQKRKKGRGRENVYDTLVSKKKKKTHPLPYLFKVEILKRFVQAEKKKDACFSSRRSSAGEGGKIFFFLFCSSKYRKKNFILFFFSKYRNEGVFCVCVGGGGRALKVMTLN